MSAFTGIKPALKGLLTAPFEEPPNLLFRVENPCQLSNSFFRLGERSHGLFDKRSWNLIKKIIQFAGFAVIIESFQNLNTILLKVRR